MKRLLVVVLFASFTGSTTLAKSRSLDTWPLDSWPQWRGPAGNSVAAAGKYPTEFSVDENVAWKVELPGRGSSTPAVWGEQIFVTCPIDGNDGVVCYDFAGTELWRQAFGREREGKHRNGTGSNPSPVTDGKHVVVYYKSGTVACVSLDGKTLWQTNLQDKYGEDTLWWDLGTSPVLAAGNAVIAVMQEGDSYLVALDLESGDVAWKQNRNYQCPRESDQSYTTPYLANIDGRDVLVTWGADHLTGHDAASGELVWECGGFNPENSGQWRVIASPATDNEVAIVPYGRGEFVAAVSLQKASGDITDTHRLWERTQIGTDVPSPLIHGQQVVLLGDKGKVYGLDKLSGDQVWQARLPKAKAKYFSSPVLAGDTLYCAREDGVVIVSKLTDAGLEVLAENDMNESIIATPIPLRGQLLVRGENHLFLIGK